MIKKAYYYLFYKLFKFSEAAPNRWLSDWKAELVIDLLEGLSIFSLIIYYTIYVNRYFQIPENYILIGLYVLGIALPNYFIFHHRDQWKKIVHKFDKLPKQKNKIGSVIVLLIVIAVITNLIFSFYLMSKIDWKLYR